MSQRQAKKVRKLTLVAAAGAADEVAAGASKAMDKLPLSAKEFRRSWEMAKRKAEKKIGGSRGKA